MKQKIRINESTLRKIVAESVKRTLNEIDWKTYANAGKKAGHGGDISTQREMNPQGTPSQWFHDAVNSRQRAKMFYDKAKEQFNQDYGYTNGKRYDNDYSSVELGGDFTASCEFAPHIRGYKSKGYGEPYKYEHGRRYDGYAGQDMSPEEFFQGDDNAIQSHSKASEEWDNYKKGNYEYDNGWKLKK